MIRNCLPVLRCLSRCATLFVCAESLGNCFPPEFISRALSRCVQIVPRHTYSGGRGLEHSTLSPVTYASLAHSDSRRQRAAGSAEMSSSPSTPPCSSSPGSPSNDLDHLRSDGSSAMHGPFAFLSCSALLTDAYFAEDPGVNILGLV